MSDVLDEARLDVRCAAYCVVCDALVERDPAGGCQAGHPDAALTGRIELDEGEYVPSLPRFNLAAFLIAPIWGPVHGQWAGAFFLPIWLFADSVVVSAIAGGIGQKVAAAWVVALTVAAQAFFARRGNGLAFRRVIGREGVDAFVARQRRWALASVPVAAGLLGWAVWFDLMQR